MGDIVDLKSKKKDKENTEKKSETDLSPEEYFKLLEEQNRKKKEKMEEKRKNANESVKRSYRLK